jgi:negative regulator of flagellin synthesis FlgM
VLDANKTNQPDDSSLAAQTKETLVKIDNLIKSPPITRSKDARSAAPRRTTLTENIAISDDVKLTSTAEKLSQLEEELRGVSISDNAKIESIRQEIAEGRFKVDEEAVADSLVRESIANISRRAGQVDD